MAYTFPGKTRSAIFDFVRKRIAEGLPPTLREIQDHFGFRSIQTIREHLDKLVADGLLAREPNLSRGLRLPNSQPVAMIPILGEIAAGELTTAIEEPSGHIPFNGPFNRTSGDFFALKIKGESMTGAGIFPGDLVIVKRQPSAENGQIVAALVDDDATIKRLRFRKGRVELHPENPAFEPIIAEDVKILGRVVEIRRSL